MFVDPGPTVETVRGLVTDPSLVGCSLCIPFSPSGLYNRNDQRWVE